MLRRLEALLIVIDRDHSLIISGTQSHFKVVEQTLAALDKLPERSEREVSFVWLRNARAEDVVFKLEAVFAARERGRRYELPTERPFIG